MPAQVTCPRCGTPLPGESGPDCPGCLLMLARSLASPSSLGDETEALGGPGGSPPEAGRSPSPSGPEATTVASSGTAADPLHLPPTAPDGDDAPRGPSAYRTLRYFGDYELLERLGEGGMGVVYRARQVSLDRLVAVKMLQNPAFASEDRRRRFRIEAEAVARLDHPHIVPILEVGSCDGQPYFSMKLIRGKDLETLLPSYRGRYREVAGLMATVADAVQHAHDRMVLHRDLKPANLLIDEEGRPHITDFGLARRLDLAAGITPTLGSVLGTPGYMALEQLEGRRDAITPRTDVYGLGALLYALLTGGPPHREAHLGKLLDAARHRPPSPPSRVDPSVPRDLEAICLKCLEKDPDRRYPSASALAEDLRRFLEHRPVTARPAGPLLRARDWCDRHRWHLASAVCGGLAGAAAGFAACLALLRAFRPVVQALLAIGLLLLVLTVPWMLRSTPMSAPGASSGPDLSMAEPPTQGMPPQGLGPDEPNADPLPPPEDSLPGVGRPDLGTGPGNGLSLNPARARPPIGAEPIDGPPQDLGGVFANESAEGPARRPDERRPPGGAMAGSTEIPAANPDIPSREEAVTIDEKVSVAIRQRYDYAVDRHGNAITVRGRRIKTADQFLEHPDEGFLHPNSRLDYRLELTNQTPDPRSVIVSRRWEEGPPREDRIELSPGETLPEAVTDSIVSNLDFTPDQPTGTLSVEVREAGEEGRLLCEPRQITFRVLKPEEYIADPVPQFRFKGGRYATVGLLVTHLDTDPTTVPAQVTVAVQPLHSVDQILAPLWIERGSTAMYFYEIVRPDVESLKFELTIDGVTDDRFVKEYTNQKLRETPPQPPTEEPKTPRL